MINEKGQFMKGQIPWNKGKQGLQTAWNKEKSGYSTKWKGGKHKQETIEKISGKNHWNWQGGIKKDRTLYISEWQKNNRDKTRLACRKWRMKNKEDACKRCRLWRKNNPNYINEWYKRKLKTDIQLSLRYHLRNRLSTALRNKQKTGSAVKDLGCSIKELIIRFESLFVNGMNWENYGLNGWHIDHIKPLASFDLEDPKQLRQACHFTNLQPLWAKDNYAKNAKIL